MKTNVWGLLILAIAAAFLAPAILAPPANAQSNPAPQSSATPSAAPSSGFRAEFFNELKYEEDRFVRLAQAIPAEKYTWRPAEGVRSVSEVFLHIAAANYNIPRRLGTPPPAGFNVQGYEKSSTDKAKIIDTLHDSFAHVRQAALNLTDADLEKQLDWIGGAKNTYRGVMIFILRHAAEHLGQLIAYARVNGIVPPWTEEQQQQQQKPKS